MIFNIKCQTCKALVSESYEFIECPSCHAYNWEYDQIGQVQLYNPSSNRKAYKPLPYSAKQLKRDLKKYKIKSSQLYKSLGKERDEFSRWLNGEKEIPSYIQAAFWMYFELIRLNKKQLK